VHAGNGEGTNTPAAGLHTYEYGTIVPLLGTDSKRSLFADWSGDVDAGGSTVTMDGNKSATATFTLRTFSVTAGTGMSKIRMLPKPP